MELQTAFSYKENMTKLTDILSVPSDNSSAFHDIAFDVVLPSIKSRLCLLLRARVFTDLSSQCLGGAGLDPAVPHLPVHLVGRWNIGYHSELQLSIFRYPVPLFSKLKLAETIATGSLTCRKTGDAASDPRAEVRVNAHGKIVWSLVNELFTCPWN